MTMSKEQARSIYLSRGEGEEMTCLNCGKPMMLWQHAFKPFSYKCLDCNTIKVEEKVKP